MNLFDMVREENLKRRRPLAERRKPRTLDDFMGQEEILGDGKLLRRLIEADRLTSIILSGPSGVGKTSLARIISHMTRSSFVTLNAVTSGVKDIKEIVEKARRELETSGHGTILFIDEIHRFNKAQQDALLPHVEAGTIVLIGATTENPYFEVIQALLSRSMVFEMYPLADEDIIAIIERAIEEDEQLRLQKILLGEREKTFIAKNSLGDARRALNILELAVITTSPDPEDGHIKITEEILSECTQRPF
jgi:putative ATPase